MKPDKKCMYCNKIIKDHPHTYYHDIETNEYMCNSCCEAFNAGYQEGKKYIKNKIIEKIEGV